tara:strand:+ start:413 stop:712 length:300 start_codon:yes stop_codon:yes gene_type:complete
VFVRLHLIIAFSGDINNIIFINTHRHDGLMGNQYSITVSDESARILTQAKEYGHKISPLIDVAIKTLGFDALQRLVTQQRNLKAYFDGKTYEDVVGSDD